MPVFLVEKAPRSAPKRLRLGEVDGRPAILVTPQRSECLDVAVLCYRHALKNVPMVQPRFSDVALDVAVDVALDLWALKELGAPETDYDLFENIDPLDDSVESEAPNYMVDFLRLADAPMPVPPPKPTPAPQSNVKARKSKAKARTAA